MPALSGRLFISLSGVLLLAHALYGREFYFLCDDAYITFRYARNMALGRGLIWNLGEAVEGYTNFLWTLLLAGGIRLGLNPEIVAPVLSILCTLGTLALLLPYARRLLPERALAIALVALGLLALNRSWNVWATGGLETRLFTFLIFAGIYCLLVAPDKRWKPVGSALLGLAALTRPDGLLLYGMSMIVLVIEWRGDLLALDRARTLPAIKRLIGASLPFVLITGAHLIFRMQYYGRPLPNTYYAKVGEPWPEMGFLFITAFLLEYGLIASGLVFTALLIFARKRSGAVRFYLYFLLIFAPHALYYAYKVGGDHFEYRIFDTALPFLALFLAHGFHLLFAEAARWKPGRWSRVLAGGVAFWLLMLYFFLPNWKFFLPAGTLFGKSGVPVEEPDKLARVYSFVPGLRTSMNNWKDAQLKLQHHQIAVRMEAHREFQEWRTRQMRPFFGKSLPADAVTEDGGIGILGYFVDITVIDRLGLTDRVVAENRIPLHDDPSQRMIAHDRRPPPGYLRERGFNLYVHCLVSGMLTDINSIRAECPEADRTISSKEDTYVARWQDFYFVYSSPARFSARTAEWTRKTFAEWAPVRFPETTPER